MRIRIRVLVLTLSLVLSVGTTALASNSTAPSPLAPAAGGSVTAGHVALIVSDPGLTGKIAPPVFLVVSHRRVLVHGVLTPPRRCNLRCDFEQMVRWPGHPGLWLFRPRYHHHGYWAMTPGVYWWQTYHYVPSCHPRCIVYSPVQRFAVVR